MNITQFQTELKKYAITLSNQQLMQFEKYFSLLVEWNKKINLTAITEKEEVYIKHFFDSLTAAFYYSFNDQTICDVGSGAGFPSIPLKIVYPNLKVSIVDSLKKRILFLQELADELQLDSVQFYHDRAETFGQNNNFREQFDIVTARAVAKMSVLSEYCLPLVKVGGTFIAMKGAAGEEELAEGKKAITLLGGEVESVKTLSLPKDESTRRLLFINKVKKTPKKYPRKPGVPAKTPVI
ncbi:16S rRNA (guanine(527)-N(7))-methyltransferase RsmG [Bacillus kwashiorkori]|uniref:16S rRNA (guanine(527)-N(7))-methyltransferase RsmG n=1 Tax=Bacillus kwashiorkori TaxID=1522318 RepID=UPI0007868087|nr:16S rRNA (guanine(527)-N(7))-methyltransferase RsmG [Bacillus kwashiorkori]